MKRPLTILATRREIELSTQPVCPPLPISKFDWVAIDGQTYDCEHPQSGFGSSEFEAVNALLDKLEEKWD